MNCACLFPRIGFKLSNETGHLASFESQRCLHTSGNFLRRHSAAGFEYPLRHVVDRSRNMNLIAGHAHSIHTLCQSLTDEETNAQLWRLDWAGHYFGHETTVRKQTNRLFDTNRVRYLRYLAASDLHGRALTGIGILGALTHFVWPLLLDPRGELLDNQSDTPKLVLKVTSTCVGEASHAYLADTGSIRTAATLYSGIFATGSRAALVSKLAAASWKWKVMKTTPGSGRSTTSALATS